MLIGVEIASFAVQAEKKTPVVILKEIGGERTLAIPILAAEASAIAIKSLNVRCDKPLTVDLVKTVIDSLEGKVDKVVICAEAGGFLTRLHIFSGPQVKVIESGCGDGIALALRCDAPMFVDDGIFTAGESSAAISERDELKKNIAATDTIEFGTYCLQ